MVSETEVVSKFQLGFTSLNSEVSVDNLPVTGNIPDWIRGSLYRNGPAKFEIGKTSYSHWFDGLAMVHRYRFYQGNVSYRNRYLQTGTYKKVISTGKVSNEFGTNPSKNPLKRYFNLAKTLLFSRDKGGYNTNVSIARFGKNLVALTEPPVPTEFDPVTLRTTGIYRFEDKLAGQLSTPHPHYDFEHRQIINYLTVFGRTCRYDVYRLPEGSRTRSLVGTIPVKNPSYMHSFATTRRYVILTEYPFTVNPFRIFTSGKSYIENFEWKPQDGALFFVMEKKSGEIVATFQAEAFFCFHHINAYEHAGDLIIDLCAFPNAEAVYGGYLNKIRMSKASLADEPNRQKLRRYHVPLSKGKNLQTIDYEQICDETIDLPTINFDNNAAQPYRFAYGTSANRFYPEIPANQLIKIDVETRTAKKWFSAGCYPGEPVFVPHPYAQSEDDGAVLSVVLDGEAGHSFLLILDGVTFEEVGRANLPHHVPFEFHGMFIKE
jgi:carotenoid cleavage dioxygenase-like enzyme